MHTNARIRRAAWMQVGFTCIGLVGSAFEATGIDLAGIGSIPSPPAGTPALLVGIAYGITLLLSVANIACAIAYLRGSATARIGLVIFSVLMLLAYPVGTAIGVYTLWAIFSSRRAHDALGV
jgi:hypothetical protein